MGHRLSIYILCGFVNESPIIVGSNYANFPPQMIDWNIESYCFTGSGIIEQGIHEVRYLKVLFACDHEKIGGASAE